MIPKVGEVYKCFSDGKIRETRMYEVTIEKVVPFGEIDDIILNYWKHTSDECDWLYKPTTDYFVFTTPDVEDDNFYEVFVRTLDDGWFGIADFSGRLDVDRKLYSSLNINKP